MTALARYVWRLGPGNPQAVRILQGGSRRTRHAWVRSGYLAVILVLVLIGLLGAGGDAAAMSLADLAKAGGRVFALIAYGQVLLVCLLSPVFMAGAIASEQSGKTYNILLTTPLSNLQIVLGALLGRLFFVLALLLSGLPLFAVLLIFGGVQVEGVFVSFAVAALTAVLVGAVAVTLSVLRTGGRKAVFAFVIAVAGYLLVTYAADRYVLRLLNGGTTTWLTPLNPMLVLESYVLRTNYQPIPPERLTGMGGVARVYLMHPFAVFAGVTMTLSLVLVAGSAVVLRRVGTGESRLLQWLGAKLRLGGISGVGSRWRRARPVGTNPVAWREANTRGKVLGSIVARYGFLAAGLTAAGVLIFLYHTGSLPPVPRGDASAGAGAVYSQGEVFVGTLQVLLLLETAVLTLVAIYMSAGSVSREREDGTLDILLTTPITPRFYIWGKLQGLVRFLALLIAVPVGTLAVASGYVVVARWQGWATGEVIGGVTQSGLVTRHAALLPESAVLLAVMLGPFVAVCVAAGMSMSLKARGVLGSVVATVGVIGLVAGVLGLCGGSLASSIPLVGAAINALSPATNIGMVLDPWSRVAGFAESPNSGRPVLFIATLAAAAVYGGIVFAVVSGMVTNFDQTVRQLSGKS